MPLNTKRFANFSKRIAWPRLGRFTPVNRLFPWCPLHCFLGAHL
jgi:hypothetical protein